MGHKRPPTAPVPLGLPIDLQRVLTRPIAVCFGTGCARDASRMVVTSDESVAFLCHEHGRQWDLDISSLPNEAL